MENINNDDSEVLTLSQAAEEAHFTRAYLNLLSRTGKLRAEKIGRNWMTRRRWLKDYLASEGKTASTGGETGAAERVGSISYGDGGHAAHHEHRGFLQNKPCWMPALALGLLVTVAVATCCYVCSQRYAEMKEILSKGNVSAADSARAPEKTATIGL